MSRLLFVHPDIQFRDFMYGFLSKRGFDVIRAKDGLEAFEKGVKEFPTLMIINKDLPGLELEGFLIKKKVTPAIKNIPIFLLGDFNSEEIIKMRAHNVKAFLSLPINIESFVERLYQFFKRVPPAKSKQTTMLMDIHAKGNILVIQIEGNFHPDKLEIMNFKLRTFYNHRKIKEPKVLFIFPSMYPENITKENFDLLFAFTKYAEFKIKNENIKVLTTNKDIINLLRNNIEFSDYEIVSNYYDGIQGLNISFNKKKEVPLELLKVGSKCIFDLFDEEGDLRIPALSVITIEIKDYLLSTGLRKLTYFSDKEDDSNVISISTSDAIMDGLVNNKESLMMEFEEVASTNKFVDIINEKLLLFLKKLHEKNALIVSNNVQNAEAVKTALEVYINVDTINSGKELFHILAQKKYLIVFIEDSLESPNSLEMLYEIRKKANKKQLSVVILSKKMNTDIVQRYRKLGTDYILLTPFSDIKILYKVFNALYLDRAGE